VGRPGLPRSARRVMLALLAVDGLSAYPLSKLAQCGSGSVYAALWRLEDRGWVARARTERYAAPPRFSYTLTPEGRACVAELLGLPAEGARRG
jgi:DNA-binding PadR family transcriptional regulator